MSGSNPRPLAVVIGSHAENLSNHRQNQSSTQSESSESSNCRRKKNFIPQKRLKTTNNDEDREEYEDAKAAIPSHMNLIESLEKRGPDTRKEYFSEDMPSNAKIIPVQESRLSRHQIQVVRQWVIEMLKRDVIERCNDIPTMRTVVAAKDRVTHNCQGLHADNRILGKTEQVGLVLRLRAWSSGYDVCFTRRRSRVRSSSPVKIVVLAAETCLGFV